MTFLTQLASAQRSAGHHQLNTSFSHPVEFADLEPGAAGLLAARPHRAGHQLDRHRGRSRHGHGRPAGAANSAQVYVNVTDANGNLVQQVNLGCAIGRSRQFHLERHRVQWQPGAAGHLHLDRAGRGCDVVNGHTHVHQRRRAPVSWAAPWSSVTWARASTGLTLNVAGQGSVPFSSRFFRFRINRPGVTPCRVSALPYRD
jgi:hypothetical protein